MNETTPTEPTPCDRHRILITDDEAPVRNIFRMILAGSIPGCSFDVASNGAEAVQSFQQYHQGVLLMDLKMPVMDGQTAIGKIRELCDEKGWEMPAVVFCTGFSPSPNIQALAAASPNNCIIQKPVTSDTLLKAVKQYLPAAG